MTAYSLALDNDMFLSDCGMSSDANALKNRLKEIMMDFSQSLALSRVQRETLEALESTFRDCSADDWDGYGAKAVNTATFYQAERFLKNLPTTFPIPEISAEPDGEIAFEWYMGPRRVVSVSIGSEGKITYAGIFGRNKAQGTEYFEGELPKTIIQQLGRLLSQGT